MLIAFIVYCVALLALFLLRKRLGLFWSVVGFFVSTMAWLKLGIYPPAPASVMVLYGGTTFLACLLYVTSSEEGRVAVWSPFKRIIVDPSKRGLLLLLLAVIPSLVAFQTYKASLPSASPPPKVRTVHPPPPSTIDVQGVGDAEASTIDLIGGDSPLRPLQTSDPEAFAEKIARGKVVYYENCFYCHGDRLAGDGHYATAVNPPPANFQDKGILPMFTETFFFWRIAKGGPGLPDGGTPWDSSMPIWEDFLSEDDMWAVILYLYEYTGNSPRAVGGHGIEHGDEGGH
ncbi:MAG TPA: hypothetical protein DIU15_06285 [Deltaproteobacteria bacterium]|nr:hypothetical protein [Deltaproteobacteria bacterium]HCP45628.1 hypothetical protein [Deltaproteobacteria bacterium]